METMEYLASFGRGGDFGRFRASAALTLRRGERVLVRGPRGVEAAEVLCPATPRHAHFLPNTSVGQLLRRLNADDEQSEEEMRQRGQRLFERARQLADAMRLPVLLLDVEMLLDGEHAVLHYVSAGDSDVRPFVSALSREFTVHVLLVDLSRDREGAEGHDHEEAGCGRPNCGQREDGGCASCGSGCSSCGTAKTPDMKRYFAQLREQMQRQRTALL